MSSLLFVFDNYEPDLLPFQSDLRRLWLKTHSQMQSFTEKLFLSTYLFIYLFIKHDKTYQHVTHLSVLNWGGYIP